MLKSLQPKFKAKMVFLYCENEKEVSFMVWIDKVVLVDKVY